MLLSSRSAIPACDAQMGGRPSVMLCIMHSCSFFWCWEVLLAKPVNMIPCFQVSGYLDFQTTILLLSFPLRIFPSHVVMPSVRNLHEIGSLAVSRWWHSVETGHPQ